MTDRTCAISDCEKPRRSPGSDWCKMHYHRWYRHGSTDKVATHIKTDRGPRRYRYITARGHPLLVGNSDRVYEHRKVLYDEIGPGPHPCHWCGTEVDWLPKAHPNELQPDHLNAITDDNRPANLVPSCRSCNTARGQQGRADALRSDGFWSQNDTVAQLRTGGRKPFVIEPNCTT